MFSVSNSLLNTIIRKSVLKNPYPVNFITKYSSVPEKLIFHYLNLERDFGSPFSNFKIKAWLNEAIQSQNATFQSHNASKCKQKLSALVKTN